MDCAMSAHPMPDNPPAAPGWACAVDETLILLHPPLPLECVSTGMERGCQQNDSLVNG